MTAILPNLSLSAADFGYIQRLVLERAAIVIEDDKRYLVESRLHGMAARSGFESVAHLIDRLRGDNTDALRRKVVDAMTTNETSFFRDVTPFEALKLAVLPALHRLRASQRRLSVWSAACSTGQEPFSVAMVFREQSSLWTDWNVEILASDLSSEALDRAKQGRFTQFEVNRGLPAALLVKYFTKHGIEWHIKDEVREMVQFQGMNLIDAWPALPPMDVILLRNVLIYFNVETKKQILARVRRVLRPDGFLFLGGAETTINLDDAFERVAFDRGSCYRLRTGQQGTAHGIPTKS